MKAKSKDTEIGMIPDDWKVKRLEDCLEIVKKQFKPTKSDIRRYIGLEHIEQQSLKLISIGSSADVESNKFEFKKDQILFGKLRPYFRKVYQPNFDGVCSTDMWVIDTKDGNVNSFFFYFLADERIINEANNSSEGTRMPRARWDYLKKLEYPIPTLNEQHRIAKILSDFDSKIELLQKQNETLEAIGQALFKHWFIDFEFPNEEGKPYKSSGGEVIDSELGEIPKGWGVNVILEVADVVDCLHRKKPNQSELGKLLLQVYNIGPHGLLDLNKKFFVSDEDYNLWTKNIELKEGDCLLTNAGLTGAIAQVPFGFTAGIGRNITTVRAKLISPYYLVTYLFSKYGQEEIEKNIDHGTIFNSLNVKGIRKIKLLIPENSIMDKFNKIIKPLRKLMENNLYEEYTLSQIRDSLLPKLMSGKIRVPVEVE